MFQKSFRYIDDINDIFFGCNSLRSVRCRSISNKENIWLEYKLYKKRLLNNHKENTFFYFQLVYKYDSHLRILGETFVKNNINECHIEYNNKIFDLCEFFETIKDNDKKYKEDEEIIILLKIKNVIGMYFMFENCDKLLYVYTN